MDSMSQAFARCLVVQLLVLFAASVAAAAALEVAPPEEVGMSSERLERLSHELQEYVDNDELAGAVVLVARRGKTVFHEAFGERDAEANVKMEEDSIFRIASQTKAVVSTAVMMLQEEGELLISDSVGKYLPEFLETTVAVVRDDGTYDVVDAERPITIRDLLTHTSGFAYGTGIAGDQWRDAGIQGWYFADREEPIAETVARMAKLPAEAQPGEAWVYGYNSDILGALVERVSGQSLDEFLSERILQPLAMTDTHFYLPQAKRDRLAVVYSATPDGIARAGDNGSIGQGAYVDGPRKSFSGGAGLLATARDYARFLQMLLNGGELDGQRILGPKSVELMTVDHLGEVTFADGEGFGLGFYVVEDLGARGEPGSVGEYGWGGAYHSQYWVDPTEELVVVYMTQLIPDGNLDDTGKLRALVYQAIIE
jgi:CubicO group peptidase (beta-lactamase class C family)